MTKTKSVIIDEQLEVELSGRATLERVKFSELLRRAAELYLDVDEFLIRGVGRFAAAYNIRPGQALTALAIQQLAIIDAETEVFGMSPKAVDGFLWINGELATGDRLYRHLKQNYLQSLNLKKETDLKKRLDFGIKLTPDEQAFLDSRTPEKQKTPEEMVEDIPDPVEREKMRKAIEYTREMNRIYREQGEEAMARFIANHERGKE